MKAPALALLILTAIASAQAVPPEIMARIRAKAEKEWPDDFRMQKYEVDQQVTAWKKLNPSAAAPEPERAALSPVRPPSPPPVRPAAAAAPAPVIPAVPEGVLARIEARAKSDFPGDYLTQKYVIQAQQEAYIAIHSRGGVRTAAQAKAAREFPDDYVTQKYVGAGKLVPPGSGALRPHMERDPMNPHKPSALKPATK